MRLLTPSTRLSLGLAALTITVLCAAQSLNVLPDPRLVALEQRTHFAESVAIAISQSIGEDNERAVEDYLAAVVMRHPELVSGAVIRDDGVVLSSAGRHEVTSTNNGTGSDSITDESVHDKSTLVTVPIFASNEAWGDVRLRFIPPTTSLLGLRVPPLVRTIVFITAAAFVMHYMFLRRMLHHMDPSQAVPQRVRNTLDTLAEGLVVLDREGRVVLANRAFASLFDVDADIFVGRPLSDLPWEAGGETIGTNALPWIVCLEQNEPVLSTTVQLPSKQGGSGERLITLLVNSTPIEAEGKSGHGVIVSFDDITPLETKKKQLAEMLQTVRDASEKVRAQNEELERLATHDPLTGCINRRRLFEVFEVEWKLSERHGHPLACAMVDVDHFKSVNDNHGHVVGDRVLARVSAALREAARETDVVARYGGEEFCVLLPHTDIAEAAAAAERFREAIAAIELPGLSVTASLGVSVRSFGAADPQHLIDQADRALYAAKRSGRNRIVRHDAVPADLVVETTSRDSEEAEDAPTTQNIPFHAVTALISALAYRDQETAAHCRRVADLAVATGEGLLSVTDCYTLEIAALLHDLGKIGVPDNILLKPDRLSNEEWEIMRRHERIGVEIVRASFAFKPLTEIVSQYRSSYSDGGPLSLGARILAIADAYDSMVTDRPYRPGRNRDEAFAELRRCAGAQFDPELVERFVATIRHGSGFDQPGISVAKETALSIGLQIENLAAALEDQDLDRLGALANRLQKVAEHYHVDKLADQAQGLARAVNDENDLIAVLESANDLLRICRSTQKSYIEGETIEP